MQRKQLNELRASQSDPAQLIPEQVLLPEAPPEQTKEVFNSIRVKGLVSRKDGRNTAWVNDSNTYQGDLATQYLSIKPKDIKADQVRITMPDQKTSVSVKVGQTYLPAEEQVVDSVSLDSPGSSGPENQPVPATRGTSGAASPADRP